MGLTAKLFSIPTDSGQHTGLRHQVHKRPTNQENMKPRCREAQLIVGLQLITSFVCLSVKGAGGLLVEQKEE